jgi:hypothetical protein
MAFDFKKDVGTWITRQIKPIIKEHGMIPGYGKSFVRECNGVVQCIRFDFTRIELRFSAEIQPVYDHYCGTALYNGVPAEIYQTEQGKFVTQHHPLAYGCWDDHLRICAGDENVAEQNRRNAKEIFDILVDFIEADLMPCFERINTLDKWHEQVMLNLSFHNPLALKANYAGEYLFGVYDCLQQRYDDGLQKLLQVCDYTSISIDEMRKRDNGYDVNHLKRNDGEGRAYKFARMFTEVLAFDDKIRAEKLQIAYEHVCHEMRVWHKLKTKANVK